MHAPVVGRRGGFQPRHQAKPHFIMSDFALGNDHGMMLQGSVKSPVYPAGLSSDSGPVLQGGGTRNNAAYGDGRTADVVSYGNGNLCSQTHRKKNVDAPMSAEAGLFSADGYAGIGNGSDIMCSPENNPLRPQDEHSNKGSDLFLFDWPELGALEDLETDLRKLGSPFEIGGNYFDDPMWPWICSADAQLVPSTSSRFDNGPNPPTVANRPTLEPTVSVTDDTTDQINMANPINTQQPSKNKGRETPLNSSSAVEIEHFPRLSDADLLCPFDDMLVPTSSSTMYCNDQIISSSSTLSGPDIPRCSAKKSHATTPDMMLDEMAENPLEMYFPPLATYEPTEVPMSGSSSTQMHHQLLPEGYFAGDGAALNISGLQFGPKGGTGASGGGLRENPRLSPISEAAPVKRLGFQKLQEGMNQLDVGAKTCIRDALYRLASKVEQRDCVDQTVGSSGAANRLKKSSVWTETQGSPMDCSVAQLLLQKPLHRKNTDRQANRVA